MSSAILNIRPTASSPWPLCSSSWVRGREGLGGKGERGEEGVRRGGEERGGRGEGEGRGGEGRGGEGRGGRGGGEGRGGRGEGEGRGGEGRGGEGEGEGRGGEGEGEGREGERRGRCSYLPPPPTQRTYVSSHLHPVPDTPLHVLWQKGARLAALQPHTTYSSAGGHFWQKQH